MWKLRNVDTFYCWCKQVVRSNSKYFLWLSVSLFQGPGVARALTGGQIIHPEDQSEGENAEILEKTPGENEGKLRKCSYLAHQAWGWENGYASGLFNIIFKNNTLT